MDCRKGLFTGRGVWYTRLGGGRVGPQPVWRDADVADINAFLPATFMARAALTITRDAAIEKTMVWKHTLGAACGWSRVLSRQPYPRRMVRLPSRLLMTSSAMLRRKSSGPGVRRRPSWAIYAEASYHPVISHIGPLSAVGSASLHRSQLAFLTGGALRPGSENS